MSDISVAEGFIQDWGQCPSTEKEVRQHDMRRLLIAASLLTFAATLILSLVQAHAGRWRTDYVLNVPAVTQDRQVLRFYDDLIQDRIFVLNFI